MATSEVVSDDIHTKMCAPTQGYSSPEVAGVEAIREVLSNAAHSVSAQHAEMVRTVRLKQKSIHETLERVRCMRDRPEVYYATQVLKKLPQYEEKLRTMKQRMFSLEKRCVALDARLGCVRKGVAGRFALQERSPLLYVVVYEGGIHVRHEPRVCAALTDATLSYAEVVRVSERMTFTGVEEAFLRLADIHGWVFERTQNKPIMLRVSEQQAKRIVQSRLKGGTLSDAEKSRALTVMSHISPDASVSATEQAAMNANASASNPALDALDAEIPAEDTFEL